MPCAVVDFVSLVGQLPEVLRSDHGRYARFEVASHPLGYLWEATTTVGLRQTVVEQLMLVGERPEVFEVQFTSGGYGWVVVHLGGSSVTSWPS